jgi:hypothetical protein
MRQIASAIAFALLAATVAAFVLPAVADTLTMIVPGASVGPINLGMGVAEAQALAQSFRDATGCTIDLEIVDHQVAGAGSSWGGCLDLALPQDTPVALDAITGLPLPTGIAGSPAPLIAAYGRPAVFAMGTLHGVRITALVWPNGLVARVATELSGATMVTYLGVITPGTTAPPYALIAIGR